ncbi:MAG TPA: AraC family transcriptional regulator ligand-binding domain-containing protein, partial [Polyangiales bacterium]|nr:AraC family transcriptional regulator ligand-binding domain-containing protein [Polyangiales bacterium]
TTCADMSSRTFTSHPMVVKLFIDVVTQLRPDLAALGPQPQPSGAPPRLTHEQGNQLLELAVQLTGRADLGVLAAQAAEPGHFDLIELASRTQRTVGEAIETLAPLVPMLQEGLELTLERAGDRARMTWRLAPGLTLHPVSYDFVVITLLIAAQRQTGFTAIPPSKIYLPYPAPQDLSALPLARALPSASFELDAQALSVEFPSTYLALPLMRADAAVGKALREVAHDVLQRAAHEKRTQLESDVRERLQAALPNGDASAAAIARQLHISERTLRRRLESEGLSLRVLHDQVRHELALTLLDNPDTSTEALAAQLGFSTAQALHRAFRRWTGLTVQAYRARLRGA